MQSSTGFFLTLWEHPQAKHCSGALSGPCTLRVRPPERARDFFLERPPGCMQQVERFSSPEQPYLWHMGQPLGIWTLQDGHSKNVLLLYSPSLIRSQSRYSLLPAYCVWQFLQRRGSTLTGHKKQHAKKSNTYRY